MKDIFFNVGLNVGQNILYRLSFYWDPEQILLSSDSGAIWNVFYVCFDESLGTFYDEVALHIMEIRFCMYSCQLL